MKLVTLIQNTNEIHFCVSASSPIRDFIQTGFAENKAYLSNVSLQLVERLDQKCDVYFLDAGFNNLGIEELRVTQALLIANGDHVLGRALSEKCGIIIQKEENKFRLVINKKNLLKSRVELDSSIFRLAKVIID